MSQWPMVPLGEILREQKRRVGTTDADDLPLLGVSNAEGLHRSGMTRINDMSRYLRVEPGWFAYNPMRINVGSIGWAKNENQTGVISPDYVVFSCTDSVCPELIHWSLKHRRGLQAINAETAGSVRERLYFESLSRIEFPLPPIAEQRRLVERIDGLAAKIEEAKGLQKQADQALNEVCRSVLRSDSDGQLRPTPMSELVALREPDVTVLSDQAYHFAGVYCFGEGVFIGQRKTGMEFKYPKLTRLQVNNFVYPKLMAWEGALAIVPPECDGLVVSTEFPVFEVHEEKVLPDVLDVYFRTPSVWPELSGASTGTNVRRRRLNPTDFLRYKFPLPPMATQQKLREIKVKAQEIGKRREPAQKELNAMLPAILDRAFKGEL